MRKVIVGLLVGAIVLDVVYWTLWYAARSAIESESTQAYYDFENAFPLGDAWLGIACLLALVALRRGHETALLWLVCAGSAAGYLFGMDFLYDVEHGIFTSGGGGVFEACIVAVTLVFAVTVLTWTWSNRASLLDSSAGRPRP
jgi:hypothetical protein